MPAVSRERAVELLTEAVKRAPADDLVEISYELFPETPVSEDEAAKNRSALVDQIVGHMSNGLEAEEIVDLWNVIFPEHWGVSFDEDEGLIRYHEGQGAVTQAD
jgi:hypothetical protein